MKQIKVNAIMYAQLIKYMLEGEHTCQELAELCGAHYVTVLQYTRELYAAGAAHICEWQQDSRGRDCVKVYKIGPGKDAKREAMSGAERQARRRSKTAHLTMLHALATPIGATA
jgi:hypothetical protein